MGRGVGGGPRYDDASTWSDSAWSKIEPSSAYTRQPRGAPIAARVRCATSAAEKLHRTRDAGEWSVTVG